MKTLRQREDEGLALKKTKTRTMEQGREHRQRASGANALNAAPQRGSGTRGLYALTVSLSVLWMGSSSSSYAVAYRSTPQRLQQVQTSPVLNIILLVHPKLELAMESATPTAV